MVSPRAENKSPCLLRAETVLAGAVIQSCPPRKAAGEGDTSLPGADGRIAMGKEGGKIRS